MGSLVPALAPTSAALRKEPFARHYGHELMAIEQEVIDRAQAWIVARRGARMEPMASFDLYALQAQAPAWLQARAAQEQCVVVGLVPHYRVFALPMLAFFPEGRAPLPRQRIRLEDAKTRSLAVPHPTRRQLTTRCIDVIQVEKSTPLPAESLYLDSDLAAGDVPAFYREHLRVDDHILRDVLLPATSAPYGQGGGIDAAGRLGTGGTKRIHDFLWLLTAAPLPPDYRSQPRLASHGRPRFHQAGVAKFGFQDLPPPGTHSVANQYASDARRLHAVLHRPQRPWESSLYATLHLPTKGESDQLKALLGEFTSAHCALPESVSDLMKQDIDLTGFERGIDSSLWKAHVMLRARQPTAGTMDDRLPDAASLARDTIDAALEPYLRNEQGRRFFVNHLMRPLPARLGQTALALARLGGRNATAGDAMEAYRLVKTNLDHMLQHSGLQRIRLEGTEMALRPTDPRKRAVDAIESVLISEGPLHLSTLIEHVQGMPGLERAQDVARLLDDLMREGRVYRRSDGRYAWVR